MQFIIHSINLKSKGFMSFFINKKFTLRIETLNFKDELILKAKNNYVGYIAEIPRNADTLKLIFINKQEYLETHTIEIMYNNKIEILIDNSEFNGTVNIAFTKNDLFLEIENNMREKKNELPVDKFTKFLYYDDFGFEVRKTYDGIIYHTNENTCITSIKSLKKTIINDLPHGWEERKTNNGTIYFVNHNKCITQWGHPNSNSKKTELENKLISYGNVLEKKYLLSYFHAMRFQINVKRGFFIQSTANMFLTSRITDFQKKPLVVFYDEIGKDYGAILKDFFYYCSIEISKDKRIKSYGSFIDIKNYNELNVYDDKINRSSAETSNITDNYEYQSFEDPENPFYIDENRGKNTLNDDDFYKYLGIFLGLAFEHNLNIAVDFSLAFYENLLGRKFAIRHIQDIKFQENINFVLKNNMDQLEILDDEGERITEGSKHSYINQKIKYCLFECKKKSYDIIRRNFMKIVRNIVVDIFSCEDLSYVFCGQESLTFEMLRNSVRYVKCSKSDKDIVFLFEILSRKDEAFLRKFLLFITGTSSIPFSSFKNNSFMWFIEIFEIKNMLLRATTCNNKLFIGRYDNEEKMNDIIIFSIDNTEGFHKA